MYFTCSKLKSAMLVTACEKNRAEKRAGYVKQACVGCTNWKAETTNPENLQTIEQVLARTQESVNQPLPMRFDFRNAGNMQLRDQYRTGPHK